MSPKCVKYKDVWVAPGAQLYELLARKEKDWERKANDLYVETRKRCVDKWMFT